MIKINNVLMPVPSTFSVSIEDIDGESERTADALLHRERLATKRKLEIEYKHLTQADSSKLLNAIQDVFFSVNYPDPQLGMTTKTFYVGARTTPVYSYLNGKPVWENMSFSFIER